MAKKSIAEKIVKVKRKITKWTVECQLALTRRQAIRALRKVAKHSEKLAELEGRLYDYQNTDALL